MSLLLPDSDSRETSRRLQPPRRREKWSIGALDRGGAEEAWRRGGVEERRLGGEEAWRRGGAEEEEARRRGEEARRRGGVGERRRGAEERRGGVEERRGGAEQRRRGGEEARSRGGAERRGGAEERRHGREEARRRGGAKENSCRSKVELLLPAAAALCCSWCYQDGDRYLPLPPPLPCAAAGATKLLHWRWREETTRQLLGAEEKASCYLPRFYLPPTHELHQRRGAEEMHQGRRSRGDASEEEEQRRCIRGGGAEEMHQRRRSRGEASEEEEMEHRWSRGGGEAKELAQPRSSRRGDEEQSSDGAKKHSGGVNM
ncbi:unnamed protein product [Closterium sp. Naga37s-1]|nr:unnamed protein product [Closterium sp. Naga37s-1]